MKFIDDKEGGPAYPVIAEGGVGSGLIPELWYGMTWLDRCAMQVVEKYIGRYPESYAAEKAYDLAEAMLAEKRKREAKDEDD